MSGAFGGLPVRPRFEVIHVPVPDAGYIVRDNHAPLIPLIAAGMRFKYNLHPPHSRYYAALDEAIAVAQWLTERAAGYPYSLMMAERPNEWHFSCCEGATWAHRENEYWA